MTSMHRVRVNWAGGGISGPAVSTLFFVPAAPTDSTASACITKVQTFLAAIKSSVIAGVTWTISGNVDDIDDHTGDLTGFHAVASATDGGSGTGTNVPPSLQINLRLETGQVRNGHRLRGHLYVPGYNGANGSGFTNGTIITSVATAASAFYGGTNPLQVWSRPVGLHGSVRQGQAQNVTGINVAQKLAVLRSRRD